MTSLSLFFIHRAWVGAPDIGVESLSIHIKAYYCTNTHTQTHLECGHFNYSSLHSDARLWKKLTMLLISDGNSDIGAQGWNNFGQQLFLRQLFRSRRV